MLYAVFGCIFSCEIDQSQGVFRIPVLLFGRGSKPADGGYYILWDTVVSLQQQFSQAVLGKLVPKFRSVCEPFQCGRRVSGQGCVTGKIQLAKSKGGEAVFLRSPQV